MNNPSTQELKEKLKNEFKEEIIETRIDEIEAGEESKHFDLWIKTQKENIKKIIAYLKQIQLPHFTTMFGDDEGEKISLSYVLTLGYESKLNETTVVLATEIPKEDPQIDSITDLISGAITTEREMQEMLGIEITNIPDDRHIYLPFDQPKEKYPWRRDEKSQDIKDVYEKEGQK